MAKTYQIFMTAGDMVRWLASAEEKVGWKLKFVSYGLFDAPQPEFASCLDIPGFGVSASGDLKHSAHYLIFPVTADITQTLFRLNDGRTKYNVDPLAHQGMVKFDPSGVCAPTHIVTGKLGTTLKDDLSVKLYNALSLMLRKQCTMSGSAAVGEEALELHRAGYRLNDRLAAHPSSDLVIRGVGKRATPSGRSKPNHGKRQDTG